VKKPPQELADRVYEEVRDFPISMDEAKHVRDDLMEERRAQLKGSEERWADHYYEFCEH
jgi:polyhydroxyalkanoate synthesis regulator phasin